ncbi:MAG: hypothetical protein PHO84_09370, partial [Dysgonamonadaceae bacterium]|nr:hypothetical protein [Dysgonamonadaceae bacterium]
GGSIVTPSYAPFDKDGKGFIVEGTGVIPDIIIENDPAEQYKGVDAQLNKAIEVILEDLRKNPVKLAPVPAFPVKTGK